MSETKIDPETGMLVKQINKKAALELAARGKEVFVMYPAILDSEKWTDYTPDTLGNMLSGCLFFRREPAMEVEIVGTGPEGQQAVLPPGKIQKQRRVKKAVDGGKLIALHNAGWPVAKIADELKVTERTVYKCLSTKKRTEEMNQNETFDRPESERD